MIQKHPIFYLYSYKLFPYSYKLTNPRNGMFFIRYIGIGICEEESGKRIKKYITPKVSKRTGKTRYPGTVGTKEPKKKYVRREKK